MGRIADRAVRLGHSITLKGSDFVWLFSQIGAALDELEYIEKEHAIMQKKVDRLS